ncbi:MAG: DUF4294 domain-containing protein [Bacteroidota bacterium]
MKNAIIILVFMMGFGSFSFGQFGVRVAVDANGIPIYMLEEVKIHAKRSRRRDRRRHDRAKRKFNKLRYNVIKVWPYANEAARNLKIIEAEMANIPTEEGKEAYLKSRETFLFGKYEKEIRQLTISQGKVLVKLIDRQTGNSAYSLIRDYKSKAGAFFWNGIGKLFGYDLKKDYDPEEEFAMEVIIRSIENGTNPTYYDYVEARNAAGKRK